MSEGAINEWIKDFLKISDDDKLRNPADFEVPIYNVWKQQNGRAIGEKLAADNSPFPADFEIPIYNVCNQQNFERLAQPDKLPAAAGGHGGAETAHSPAGVTTGDCAGD